MLDTCDRGNKCNNEGLTLFHYCCHGYNIYLTQEKKATSKSAITSNKLIFQYILTRKKKATSKSAITSNKLIFT